MYIDYKWLITTIIFSFVLLIEIVVKLIPHLEKKRKEKKEVYSLVEKEITKITEDAKKYRAISEISNLKKIKSPPKLIKRLEKIIELLDEYNNWYSECNEIILNKLKVDDRANTEKLRQQFGRLGKRDFDYNICKLISPLIYEGELNCDSLKEKILSHYGRDLKISTHNGNNVKELTLREIVKSAEFFDLAKRLKELENLMSIKTFRKIRKEFISRCKKCKSIVIN